MATNTIPSVQAEKRDRLGSRYAARQRKLGRLPGVIYGHQKDPLHVSMDREEVVHILHARAHLMEVVVDAKSEPCLVKSVQWDHLGSKIIHIDLARVDLTERVRVHVDLEFTGEAIGLKQAGAILEHPLNSLEIECLATQIPQSVIVDVHNLDVDQFLTVKELVLPEGVKAIAGPDTIVVAVHVVSEEPEPTAAVAEGATAGTEPEVIGRPAKEEGEEDAKPKK
ncbi:MAG: 50S ribosomal protein L25 [Phycisphaeraceae bacterium]|nr:50S ribosomal protein L25 [Phycisphaeraceae bacterium]